MKHVKTGSKRAFFKQLAMTKTAQAAMMVLQPSQSTGEPSNEHPRSEQWLYVIAGTGKAKVTKRTVALAEGSLLLIEKGETHEIRNTGRKPLVTISFYAPPAYDEDGEPLQE